MCAAVTFELFEVVKDCVIGGNLSFGGAMKAHQSALIDALYGMNLLFTTCLFFLPHTVQGFVSRPAVSQRKSTLRDGCSII